MNEEHTPGTLGGRQIYWCPSGEGYLPYCPQTTDPTDYNYCCVYEEFGIQRPSCCRHAIHTGLVIALLLSAIIVVAMLIFFTCWFCPLCPISQHSIKSHKRQLQESRYPSSFETRLC